MKTIELITMAITGLLLFSTIVCGLWLQYSGEEITDGSRVFHMASGLLAALSVVFTFVLLLKR